MMHARVLVALLVLVTTVAPVGALQLTWTAPTTNTNGKPLTDLVGYVLYYRAPGVTSWTKVGEVQGTTVSVLVHPPRSGDWMLRSINAVGIESEPSNIVTTTQAMPPTGVEGVR